MRVYRIFVLLAILPLLNGCAKEANTPSTPLPKIFTASGNIQPFVDLFRQELGPLNTTTDASDGRREISWEAVPDELLEKKLPAQFFNQLGDNANPALQRGLVYDPSTDFRVSKTSFAGIAPEAAGEFKAFSGSATFANVATIPWPVSFQVAGTAEAAASRGFGVVVSDVDTPSSVQVEYYNGSQLLGRIVMPAKEPGSHFSFAGVVFNEAIITQVKISHDGILSQNAKDISQGGAHDLVVFDDFIYGEPVKK